MVARSKKLAFKTIADLLEMLGGIDPGRILATPFPGTATEKDVIAIHNRTDRLYELIDGVLVEKIMGYPESCLTLQLGRLLGNFLAEHDLGLLAGPDGTVRLMPGLVRIPDLSFVSWRQLPNRMIPTTPIPHLAPDLAVEVLSKGNTPGEMVRKLKDYFFAGVRLVWLVHPGKRCVEVFTAPDQSRIVTEDESLDGGEVLPGLVLPLRDLFAHLPREQRRPTRKGNSRRRPRKRRSGNGS
jgi:Uma2 family endonuclease